jgi:hypothetical protein
MWSRQSMNGGGSDLVQLDLVWLAQLPNRCGSTVATWTKTTVHVEQIRLQNSQLAAGGNLPGFG